jgi:hypothetical protein
MHLEEILINGSPKQRLMEFTRERLGGRCIYCGYTFDNLTCDHIKPRCKGGQATHYNLAPACRGCNEAKGTKDVWLWWEASPYWLDALEDGRVTELESILSDERSLADWLLSILEDNPQFKLKFEKRWSKAL